MGGSRFLLPFGIGLCLALSPLAAQTREATIEGAASATPVPRVSPALAASLAQAISREIKPHWKAPQGSDADHLVTVLAWELNPDGSLKAKPIVVSQSGITDRNSTLAATHAAHTPWQGSREKFRVFFREARGGG